MNNTVVLMKLLTFILLSSVIFGFVALDETFKEMEAHRQGFENLQATLDDSPLDDLTTANEANFPVQQDVEGGSTIPVIGPVIDFFADVGAAVWGGILTFIAWVSAGVAVAGALISLLVLFLTFTFPGIPFEAQAMLWSISTVMWGGIFYIGFRAIRGGG